jgi:hypothetical protein
MGIINTVRPPTRVPSLRFPPDWTAYGKGAMNSGNLTAIFVSYDLDCIRVYFEGSDTEKRVVID